MSTAELDDRAVADLLGKTSRTFAASIPLLEEPARRAVGLAYLLFRIADTFEDAAVWTRDERCRALADFAELVSGERDDATALIAAWRRTPPTDHGGYLELLDRTGDVVAATRALGAESWATIERHTLRTIRGMEKIVRDANDNGSLELLSLSDLRDYCYIVAGIVGELLTDLFVVTAPALQEVRLELDFRAATFGEALQLVNILKDAHDDAAQGRVFLPAGVAFAEVLRLARHDLDVAVEYVQVLRRDEVPTGHVAFVALPLILARATLDAVEEGGAGSKVSRQFVFESIQAVRDALSTGAPLPLGEGGATVPLITS